MKQLTFRFYPMLSILILVGVSPYAYSMTPAKTVNCAIPILVALENPISVEIKRIGNWNFRLDKFNGFTYVSGTTTKPHTQEAIFATPLREFFNKMNVNISSSAVKSDDFCSYIQFKSPSS
jgi:hypothetical protein